MNYTGIPTSLAFLVSKMGLTTPLAQMVSWKKIFEVVVEEVVMKCKNCMFFSFWYFILKFTFFRLRHFLSPVAYPINSVLLLLYVYIRFVFLMKHFSS